ncbi:hypothetical protein ABZ860_28635 [Microbispora sp. NPDC046973]|uniref:hypothetical protein n=1 Tax=Microbispora sp. NPDC046973 TaxID=3155022 RepID=UPI0033F22B30
MAQTIDEMYVDQVPDYRCTFPREYALGNKLDHPRNVYLREDAILRAQAHVTAPISRAGVRPG